MDKTEKTERMRAVIKGLMKNEIHISFAGKEVPREAHSSGIGGKPELPEGFEWPYYYGESYDGEAANRPLSFIAQFNMSELSAYDTDGLLPRTGMLCFFYELMTQCWGFDPVDRGCSRVYYFEDVDSLQKTEPPDELDTDLILPELPVSFERWNGVPSYDEICSAGFAQAYELIEKDNWEFEEYEELIADMGVEKDDSGDYTKLLGYPDIIQNPMELECEQSSRGMRGIYTVDSGEVKRLTEEERADVAEAAGDWTLLFQLSSFECGDYYLSFGDSGSIYFWIRKQELAEKRFDNCWLILQCF